MTKSNRASHRGASNRTRPAGQRPSPRTRDRAGADAADLDAIRIVALYPHRATETTAAPSPQLTYRGGPLLGAVQVFTIFWGAAWSQAPQHAMVGMINAFFDFVLTSELLDQLTEYGVTRYSIGHGRRIGAATVTSGLPGSSVTDRQIQHFVQQQIKSRVVPMPTPNTLYFIYVAPGVRVVMGGSASCQAFCGYHNAIGKSTFYAVMPFPGCSGCTGQTTVADALTSTSSHELCEAITDPIPGQGWYDDTHGEIGDICAWQTKTIGGYTVQLEWSNKANRCV